MGIFEVGELWSLRSGSSRQYHGLAQTAVLSEPGSWLVDLRLLFGALAGLRRVLCFFRGNFLPGGRRPNVGDAGLIDGHQVTAVR